MAAAASPAPHAGRVLGALMKKNIANKPAGVGVVSVSATAPIAAAAAPVVAASVAPPQTQVAHAPAAVVATPAQPKQQAAPTPPAPAAATPPAKTPPKLTGLLAARRPPPTAAAAAAAAAAPQQAAPQQPPAPAPKPPATPAPASATQEEDSSHGATALLEASDSDAEEEGQQQQAASQKAPKQKRKPQARANPASAPKRTAKPKQQPAPADEEAAGDDGGDASEKGSTAITKRIVIAPPQPLVEWFQSRSVPDETGIDEMARIERARQKEPWMDLTKRGLLCVSRMDMSPEAIARRTACLEQAEHDSRTKCKGAPSDDYVPNRYLKLISNTVDVSYWYHPTMFFIEVCSDYAVASFLESNPRVLEEDPEVAQNVGYVLGRASLRQLFDVPAPAQAAKQGNRRTPTNTKFTADTLNPAPQLGGFRFVPDLLIYDQQKGAPVAAAAPTAAASMQIDEPQASVTTPPAPTHQQAQAAAPPAAPVAQKRPAPAQQQPHSADEPVSSPSTPQPPLPDTPSKRARSVTPKQQQAPPVPSAPVQHQAHAAADVHMSDAQLQTRGPIGTSLVDGIGVPQVLSYLSRATDQLGLAAQQASLLLSSSRIERNTLDLLFNNTLEEGRSTNKRLSILEESVKELNAGMKELSTGVKELTAELRKIANSE